MKCLAYNVYLSPTEATADNCAYSYNIILGNNFSGFDVFIFIILFLTPFFPWPLTS